MGISVSNAMKLHFQSIIKNIHIKGFVWLLHFFPGGPLKFPDTLWMIWAYDDQKDKFQNYQTT